MMDRDLRNQNATLNTSHNTTEMVPIMWLVKNRAQSSVNVGTKKYNYVLQLMTNVLYWVDEFKAFPSFETEFLVRFVT
jgi:hypothetical protein